MSRVSIDFNAEVPMRDGTVLRADVYRPSGPGPYPVLLQRTPYDRSGLLNNHILDTLTAVKRGFIVVIQDTRGRFDSEGEWLPWAYEQQDGYDTVAWAARLAGSTGNVAMYGSSYTGQTQWAAALTQPPALAAIVPQMTWSDPADGLMFRGGAIELGLNAFWTLGQTLPQLPKVIDDPNELFAAMSTTIGDFDSLATKGYWELPAEPLPAISRAGQPDVGVHRGLQNPETTEECRVVGHHDQVTVPSLNIGGWYDVFQQGTLDNYISMRARGVPTQLVVGPWQHAPRLFAAGRLGDGKFGVLSDVPLGSSSISDFQLDWLETTLRGEAGASGVMAPVKIFVMGINQWRDEQDWPLQRAVATPLYLHGEGGLSFDQPTDQESCSIFVYDPADPVPTCGGNLVLTQDFPAGPKDQSAVERRSDVLVFTSEEVTDDLEITGRVKAELFAATDGPTTDWVVKLCDVDENGLSLNIVDGIVRVTTEPGRIDENEVDLWSTSIVIKAGHRLRVQISSSNFPRWDRNPNTDSKVDDPNKFRVAQQTIHHNARYLSRLVLPIVTAPTAVTTSPSA